jgi:tRNA-specific 2-thiouridylase
VVDESGRLLGHHDGYWRFTRGQRRGLGIVAAEPLYAIRTHPHTNTVVVGPQRSLATAVVDVRGELFAPVSFGQAKLRYRSPAVPARVTPTDRGFELHLEEPAFAVAPGQTAVIYEDDAVVGAGVVSSAAAPAA